MLIFQTDVFAKILRLQRCKKDANLVELEKCCRTHIFLQNFVLIQPRTSPPKICKIFEKCLPKAADAGPGDGAAAQRRKDVDGLRALAVAAVVLYHIDDALVPGGFTGVSCAAAC